MPCNDLDGTAGDVGGALGGLDDKVIVEHEVASMGLQLRSARGVLGDSEAGRVAVVEKQGARVSPPNSPAKPAYRYPTQIKKGLGGMAGWGWINSLLGLGAVAAVEAGLDDTEDLVGLLARGLRVDGGDVGKVVPVLVAGGRQKGLLELDDGRGAGGDVLEHDELTLGGEHVGKGVGGLGVLGRGVEPAKGGD